MPDTYTQLIIHLVFSVRFRRRLITEPLRQSLQRYMTGVIQKRGHKLLAIYCMPDHVHILIGLNPNQSISELVKEVKVNSTNWINEKHDFPWNSRFRWQEGYGAFSYSKTQLPRIVAYIKNQPEHHRKKGFKEEYRETLEKFGIDYELKYVFDTDPDVET